MRYFEIAKPPARHILANADPRTTVGERRSGRMRDWGAGKLITGTAILPDHKTYLIYRHVGGIYRPGVRNSAGEFPPSQPTAANPFFKGPTDYFLA